MVSWAALDQNRQNECSTASALKLLSAGFPQQTKWAARNTPFCGPSPSLQPTSTHRNACCMFWLSIAFLFWLSLVFAFWLPFSRASPCCFEFCFFWFAVPVPVSKLWCSSPSLGRPWFCPLNSYSRLCFPRAGLYAGANPGPISPIARDDMLIIHQGQFAKGRSWVMVGQPEQQNYNTSVTHPKNIHDLNKKLTGTLPLLGRTGLSPSISLTLCCPAKFWTIRTPATWTISAISILLRVKLLLASYDKSFQVYRCCFQCPFCERTDERSMNLQKCMKEYTNTSKYQSWWAQQDPHGPQRALAKPATAPKEPKASPAAPPAGADLKSQVRSKLPKFLALL